MERGFNEEIIKIAKNNHYAKNGDEPEVWISAIQKVYDEHKSDIEGKDKYGEFHSKKVYFYNKNYGNSGHCMYLAVQRKNTPGKKSAKNDGVIDIDINNISSDSDDELLGSLSEIGSSSDEEELLSDSDSDLESEDRDRGPLVGYNKDIPTKSFTTKSGKVVYVNSKNKKDKRLYNKDGEYIGKLNDDGSIESAEDAIKRVNKEANKKGGRKKKRRTKKKRKRKRTKKKRKRRRRKTRK